MTVRLIPGAERRLLDASPSAVEPGPVDDHTPVRAAGARRHAFGIRRPEPAAPLDETFVLHASADDLDEHCAEVVVDGRRTWITGGWGRGGLTLRPAENCA